MTLPDKIGAISAEILKNGESPLMYFCKVLNPTKAQFNEEEHYDLAFNQIVLATGKTVEMLQKYNKTHEYIHDRHIVIKYMSELFPDVRIGYLAKMMNRDRTTAINSLDQFNALYSNDPKFRLRAQEVALAIKPLLGDVLASLQG